MLDHGITFAISTGVRYRNIVVGIKFSLFQILLFQSLCTALCFWIWNFN